MALELGISIVEDSTCDGLKFYETTGQYNGTTNTTGWDELGLTPSIPATSTILRAELDITPPGGSKYTFNVLASFPTVDDTVSYSVAPSDLGYTDDSIVSGVYLVTYTVWDSASTDAIPIGTKSCYVLLSCAAKCCIDKMFAKVPDEACCGDCEKQALAAAITTQGYLCAAISALGCNRPTDAQTMMEKVLFMCNLENCKCNG